MLQLLQNHSQKSLMRSLIHLLLTYRQGQRGMAAMWGGMMASEMKSWLTYQWTVALGMSTTVRMTSLSFTSTCRSVFAPSTYVECVQASKQMQWDLSREYCWWKLRLVMRPTVTDWKLSLAILSWKKCMPVEGTGWLLQIWEQSLPLFSISSFLHLYCEQYLQLGSIFISSLVPNLAAIKRCIRTNASSCSLRSRSPRSTIKPSTFLLSSSRSRFFCSLDVLRLMPSCSSSLYDELSESYNLTFPSSSLIISCPFLSSLFFSPRIFLMTGFLPRLFIMRMCSYYSRLTSASRLAYSLTTFGLFLRFRIFFYFGTPRLRGSSFSNSFLCLFCFFFALFFFGLTFSGDLYFFSLGLRPLRTGSSSSFTSIALRA